MGKHSGTPANETPVDPRQWEDLSSKEQDRAIDRMVEFDAYDARLTSGDNPGPAPTAK